MTVTSRRIEPDPAAIEEVGLEYHLSHRLGRHVRHDSRSLDFQVQPAGSIASVAWERLIGVLDQGSLGSCTGNAATGSLGTKPDWDSLSGSEKAALDEDFAVSVYSDAEKLDGGKGLPTEDNGSSGLSVAKVCKTRGLISGYLHATSIAAMNTALQSGPVIVGVNWYSGFDNPDASGHVTISGSIRGGHEFEVIGYDVTTDTYTAVNSWGTSWGNAGRFTFSGKDMARLLAEQGDCTQLLPLSVPAPVPTPKPVADAADKALWAYCEAWTGEHHRGDNLHAAEAVVNWAAAKGFLS